MICAEFDSVASNQGPSLFCKCGLQEHGSGSRLLFPTINLVGCNQKPSR